MTLTNKQTNIIDSLMHFIAPKVLAGMSPIDALREALDHYNELACEVMDGQTRRGKIAQEYMFTEYCRRAGINKVDNAYKSRVARVLA